MEQLDGLPHELVVVQVEKVGAQLWKVVGLCRLNVIFRGIDAELADIACSSSGSLRLGFVQRYEPNISGPILSHCVCGE